MAVAEAPRPGRLLGVADGAAAAVHALAFSPEPKAPAAGAVDFEAALRAYLPGTSQRADRVRAVELCQDLTRLRAALLKQLDSPAVSDVSSQLNQALSEYLAALLGFVNAPEKAHDKVAHEGVPAGIGAGDAEARVEPSDAGASLDGAVQDRLASSDLSGPIPAGAGEGRITGDSPLRQGAIPFRWKDVMFTRKVESSAHDTLFELTSAVLAVAIWHMRRAAYLCRDTRAGTSLEDATKGYQLLQAACGMFHFIEEQCTGLVRATVASTDCHRQAAAAYAAICLADAQAITVRRAIVKGNAPGLIAGLAFDTEKLLHNAAAAADAVTGTLPTAKARAYIHYQANVHAVVAAAFAGQAQLADGQAGAALRWLQDAQEQVAGAEAAGKVFDRALPVTGYAAREHYAEDLTCLLAQLTRKAEQDNRMVYFQPVPAVAPPAPALQRLAAPAPYSLPSPSAATAAATVFAPVPQAKIQANTPALPINTSNAGPANPAGAPVGAATAQVPGGAAATSPPSGKWWQWLLVILAMPLLFLVSLVGAVVWILLLPVKCFCCPLGCAAQLLWTAVEWLLKAPLRAMLWASGKPWQPQPPPDLLSGQQLGTRANHGVAMHDRVPPV